MRQSRRGATGIGAQNSHNMYASSTTGAADRSADLADLGADYGHVERDQVVARLHLVSACVNSPRLLQQRAGAVCTRSSSVCVLVAVSVPVHVCDYCA
jgi:hypothetical protein